MRLLALFLAIALVPLSGCVSTPWQPQASLAAIDGTKLEADIVVRLTLKNQDIADMPVHHRDFTLKAGLGTFTCRNQPSGWTLVEVDTERLASHEVVVPPGGVLFAYLKFKLCPDVAGPYSLRFEGATGAAAQSKVPVRPLGSRGEIPIIED